MAVLWGWIECVGRGVFAHLDIADVCFAGVFRPSDSGALMVYCSNFCGVADEVNFGVVADAEINLDASSVYFLDVCDVVIVFDVDAKAVVDAKGDVRVDADANVGVVEICFAGSLLSINGVDPIV